MRSTVVLMAICLGCLSQRLGAEMTIFSKGTVKVGCGSFEKSTPVTITKAAPGEVSAEIQRLKAALKAAGATYPQTEVLAPGTAYAIAVVQKQVGKCEWEIQMWRTSKKGAEAAKNALQAAIRLEPNVISSSITTGVAVD